MLFLVTFNYYFTSLFTAGHVLCKLAHCDYDYTWRPDGDIILDHTVCTDEKWPLCTTEKVETWTDRTWPAR